MACVEPCTAEVAEIKEARNGVIGGGSRGEEMENYDYLLLYCFCFLSHIQR